MFSYRLAAVFAHSIEASCSVENEDVVSDAPTTFDKFIAY